MTLRSLLFVPGDSEKKLAKAEGVGADALILDLEDSVAPARKDHARALVVEYLNTHRENRSALWVRINPLDSGRADDDLEAIVAANPNGVMLPKAHGAEDTAQLCRKLDHRSAPGATKVIPVATETPAAVFKLASFADATIERLAGITWGAEDLAAALGAADNRGADGEWSFTYKLARSLTLLAARAAGVQAIETLHADFRDLKGLETSSRAARVEGFSGRLAIHPDQVAVINAAFTPSVEEVAFARRVVEAFAASPEVGTIGMDGKMLDQPHLKAALTVIAQHEAAERRS